MGRYRYHLCQSKIQPDTLGTATVQKLGRVSKPVMIHRGIKERRRMSETEKKTFLENALE